MKPWKLALVIAAGIAVGRLASFANAIDPAIVSQSSEYVLYVLLLLVGILIGADRAAFAALRRAGPRFVLAPIAIAIGSVIGGLAMIPFSGLNGGQTLAVASGMGWYSLSGVILAGMGFAQASATAVLANILRELLALITIPWIAKHLHPFQTLAPAGATATDVTLPVIIASAGTEMGMLAVACGSIVSLFVPLLAPLFAPLG